MQLGDTGSITSLTCYLMARAPTTNAPTPRAAMVTQPLPTFGCLATAVGGGSTLIPSLMAAYKEEEKRKGKLINITIVMTVL